MTSSGPTAVRFYHGPLLDFGLCRCELWSDLLGQEELRSLWLVLLGSAGPAACGTDAPWVLGHAMAFAFFVSGHAPLVHSCGWLVVYVG